MNLGQETVGQIYPLKSASQIRFKPITCHPHYAKTVIQYTQENRMVNSMKSSIGQAKSVLWLNHQRPLGVTAFKGNKYQIEKEYFQSRWYFSHHFHVKLPTKSYIVDNISLAMFHSIFWGCFFCIKFYTLFWSSLCLTKEICSTILLLKTARCKDVHHWTYIVYFTVNGKQNMLKLSARIGDPSLPR